MAVDEVDIPPDGPSQMAVLYTHGFNDDGAAWGTGEGGGSPLSLGSVRDSYQDNTETGFRFLADHGIPSYAVQWTVNAPDTYSNPYATADEGFAFLADEAKLKEETDWLTDSMALHNRARPNFVEVLLSLNLDRLAPQYALLEPAVIAALTPRLGPYGAQQAGRRTFYLGLTANRNTYNDSGRVEDHSTDLLDLLREERVSGELDDYRQVNILTHSKGSLVTRVMLSKAEAAGGEDAEYVANVVYNAPPFGGSSLAELLKFMYDPIVVVRAHLANPWLAQTWDEIADSLLRGDGDVTNPRLGDQFRMLMRLLCEPFGCDFNVLENQLPVLQNNIELLNVFSIEAFTLSAMANDPALTPAAGVGDLIAGGLNIARPFVTSAMGIPSFPTAREDLPPETAVGLLQTHPTAALPAQFVNAGTSSPFGVRHMLWPSTSYASIAADPSQVYDAGDLQGQANDTYVALGSALLLTETDTFGPRMTLGGVFNTDHGGTTLNLDVMGTTWLSILLAPPTTLHLSGTVAEVSGQDRLYAVSADTAFSFVSSNFLEQVVADVDGDGDDDTVFVSVEAMHHQYRFVPRFVADPVPTAWEQMNLGQSRTFGDAVAAHGLAGAGFEIQWRAVNLRGGREMIRSAHVVVAEEAPNVTDLMLQGNAAEIHRRHPRRIRAGNAVRSTFFDGLTTRALERTALKARPEPDWWINDPATKYLVAVFDKRGSVDYAWNDPTLSAPVTLADVNALFLTLESLAPGYHTLTFQPFAETLGVEKRGAVQTLNVFVDETPPEHAFAGLELDAFSFRVGPATPLQYRAQDLESGGATGALSVFGFSNTTFASGATFTLGETDLVDQLKSGPGGDVLVGGFITFAAAATDLVGNVSATNFQAYFDFAPPTLTNVTVRGGIPTSDGAQVFTNEVVLAVDVREPNTSEYLPPCAAVQNAATGQASCSAPFTYEQTVGAYARYTGTVYLAKGLTAIQVVCQDVYGNASSLPLVVEYLDPPPSDGAPLAILTPRIDNENSLYFDTSGAPTNFTAGSILSPAFAYDGSRVVFASTGNGFVYGDSNRREDVFLSEGGRIVRASVGASGEQALGGDSDSPAISGDGRYVFFRSSATNLVPGTSNYNLFVKDLESGEMAVISRHFNGDPINRLSGTFFTAPTGNGRYVFFATRNASYVDGLVDANTGQDVYMVDLDPDGNGYYFDDNYVTVPISTMSPTRTGNGESREPCVSDDGRYLVFETQATDITADLALNGSTTDALLMKFSGSAWDGTLDVSNRMLYVVNRAQTAGGGTTALGINRVCIAPDGDTILFTTRSNIEFSQDTNSEATQDDVYASIGQSFGISSFGFRISGWQSRGVGNTPSVIPSGQQVGRLTVASSLRPSASFNNKIAWVSAHSNLVPGDGNGRADVFIGTAGGLGVPAMNPPAVNWIASNITSSAAVQDGGLTPDGRSAWWITTQTYTAPYTSGRSQLYLRRIDPVLTNELTVITVGHGSVVRTPAGSHAGGTTYAYTDDELDRDTVNLAAAPDPGWRFDIWQGADEPEGSQARVRLLSDRTVTAVFASAAAPVVDSLSITTLEDQVSAPLLPGITDSDPDDVFALKVQSSPSHGTAVAEGKGLVYTPVADFFGADAFTLVVTDAYGLTATATVSVVVQPVNDPPVVGAELALALSAGKIGPFVPAVTDPDPGDTASFSILLQPAHGVAWADENGLHYTAEAGYSGPDGFTFRVTDGAGASDTGSIQLDVVALPSITQAEPDVGLTGFTLQIGALPAGVAYTVECKADLLDAAWLPVPPAGQWPSTGTSFQESFSTQRFYRLRFEILDP